MCCCSKRAISFVVDSVAVTELPVALLKMFVMSWDLRWLGILMKRAS